MNLFPHSPYPYLIVSPSYTDGSSGVRTLHLLCHALNESGQKAYIVQDKEPYTLNPDLNTPLLLAPHWNYLQQTQKFIAVYPDIAKGNPLNAKHVVRYLLAPRGAYGGDSVFPDTDQVWGALPSIADNVLRIPVSDPNIFHDTKSNRSGSCFYSHKYDRIHGNNLLPITDGMTRLEGSLEQLADILRKSEACYLYELTSVITEAALCGCPVILIKTDYFNTIDPTAMMGNVRWDDGELVKKCNYYLPEYLGYINAFEKQLENFIEKTQEMA